MVVCLQHRQLLLVPLLLLLAYDSAFGRFLPSPTEQHHRFKRDIEDIFLLRFSTWNTIAIGSAVYLAIATCFYIGTFCCALEKKCAAAAAHPPTSSSVSVGGASASISTSTAKSPSQASLSTALQTSIRIDSRTQRETERAAAASRKSVKAPQSARLPTASAKEKTASKKTTSSRTLSRKSESKETGTSSKKKRLLLPPKEQLLGKVLQHRLVPLLEEANPATKNLNLSCQKPPAALPAVRMRVQLAVDRKALAEKNIWKRIDKYINLVDKCFIIIVLLLRESIYI
ncbi:hypothetical protein Mgra_00001312 [Meloidogyne graminicola]|uniref:Uncharacterized protein n=1 Tax=Meloidogyne graminicola TaxID=189291 RepID=A0A8T0A1S4_9BILA|nr:hypothetical protein Mgra_00001312 [Meloidogyne graminicola]